MVPEAQPEVEDSEDAQEEAESLASSHQKEADQESGSEEDLTPSTRGDIKKLLRDLRKVWKEDLHETQKELDIVTQKIKRVEEREKASHI
ncbi:Hypothetical predicted protein [Pelobates cultripes]|uniref:Uncharacterized protein n=1 Tax=Pelobates cultripes TaxID=61616 RepID=A0AAD1TC52_PELCU|nr:Hypothetical predicted protein [Pelobates cultripes]